MVGKQVAHRVYVHSLLFDELDELLRVELNRALEISNVSLASEFNVARIDSAHQEVAFLDYPDFFSDPFPALATSRRVHLPTMAMSFRDYRESLNPPILHRKELLLPKSHPATVEFAKLTAQAESIGLFEDPVRIGFRKQWQQLIASKGYALNGHQFVPIGNASPCPEDAEATDHIEGIARHRTALSRNFLSAPVQALLRLSVLQAGDAFFDYGCGRGDDITGLTTLGFKCGGWDPHFCPNNDRVQSHVVNLGFVINVIEDMQERVAALRGAYELTKGALAVAAMLSTSTSNCSRKYADGVLTSRNTFQRYYTQAELQSFIESVLDEHAYPVGPGIFFVFKDRHLEHRFLVSRQLDPTRAPRLLVAKTRFRPTEAQLPKQPAPEDPRQVAALQALWEATLGYGRLLEVDEYHNAAEIIELFGSWNRSIKFLMARPDSGSLGIAADARRDELRVQFALHTLQRTKLRGALEPRFRRDVRAFFGSLSVAETEGLHLLQMAASPEIIGKACEEAAMRGLGFLEQNHSLQLHSLLVRRLAPVLRAYVASATLLFGEVSSVDLVKIHIQSGKVTLMKFDNFHGSPLPRLIERTKVRLREQDFDYFEYGEQYEPPLLFYKSRYINEEHAEYPKQLAFDQALAQSGIVPTVGYGPSEVKFNQRLQTARLRIDGWRLASAVDIPDFDQPCGLHFTYRDLIECGETWASTHAYNTPKRPETFNALHELATTVLDPVIDYFGGIELTYGFASAQLARCIGKGIAPKIDQHVSCELNTRNEPFCTRLGAAVDFLIRDEDMREVARWIHNNCQFDRLYFYGTDRPLHVSIGPEMARATFEMVEKGGKRIPRAITL